MNQCLDCGKSIVSRAKRCKVCFAKSRIESPNRTCKQCGTVFNRRPSYAKYHGEAIYCSHKCRIEANPVKVKFNKLYFKQCKACFKPFTTNQPNKIYCNKNCGLSYQKVIYKIKFQKELELRDKLNCIECNKIFTPIHNSKFCSFKCSNKNYKRIRRLQFKAKLKLVENENVNPIKVFERDLWHCKLCGVHTPRQLMGTVFNNAPELDHIMPISKGGSHTYANTQCLCRLCNQIKSNKIYNNINDIEGHIKSVKSFKISSATNTNFYESKSEGTRLW